MFRRWLCYSDSESYMYDVLYRHHRISGCFHYEIVHQHATLDGLQQWMEYAVLSWGSDKSQFLWRIFFYLILILNLLLGNALKKLNYLSRYRYLESKSVQNTSRRIFSVSFMETVKFQCKLQIL